MDIDSQAAELWSRAMKAESHAEWADRRIDELEAERELLRARVARLTAQLQERRLTTLSTDEH